MWLFHKFNMNMRIYLDLHDQLFRGVLENSCYDNKHDGVHFK